MTIGEPFSPFKLFNVYCIPECLMSYKGISPAAKLCWSSIGKFCGNRKFCWPGVSTIARCMGVCERSVHSYLKELEADGFLRIAQRGLRQTNKYTLLRHRIFVEALAFEGDDEDEGLGGGLADQERQTLADQERQTLADPYHRTEVVHRGGVHLSSGSASNPSSERTSEPDTVLRIWNKTKGLGKPNGGARALLREYGPVRVAESDLPAALGKFAGWCREKNPKNPMAAFLKSPESWVPAAWDDDYEPEATPSLPIDSAPAESVSSVELVPLRNFPAEWNSLVPAAPCEWDPKRGRVLAKALAECAADQGFCDRFVEVCELCQRIHQARPGDVSWLTFAFIIQSKKGNPAGWWRVLSEFNTMVVAPMNGRKKTSLERHIEELPLVRKIAASINAGRVRPLPERERP